MSACGLWLAVFAVCQAAPTVTFDYGTVIGVNEGSVSSFYAVPYAEPPVGDLRWVPPVRRANFTAPLVADRLGPACPQPPSVFAPFQADDCLHLNIHMPRTCLANGEKLPVFVFWYGGGYVSGGNNYDWYNLSAMVARSEQPFVAVVPNYRVGLMGFLAGSELRLNSGSFGNYGLRDQQYGLQWIQENIAHFCGDATRVTISGQSAGSFSTALHYTIKSSWPLFQRGLMMSGSIINMSALSADFMQKQYDIVLKLTGCTNATCLRALPTESLVNMTAALTYDPVIDGVFIERNPLEAVQEGDLSTAPALLGSCAADGTTIVPAFYPTAFPSMGEDQFLPALKMIFGPMYADEISELYAPTAGQVNATWWALGRAVTDSLFRCPASRMAFKLQNSYVYRMVHVMDSIQEMAPALGALHGSDLYFNFHANSYSGYQAIFPAIPSVPEVTISATEVKYQKIANIQLGELFHTGKPSIPSYLGGEYEEWGTRTMKPDGGSCAFWLEHPGVTPYGYLFG